MTGGKIAGRLHHRQIQRSRRNTANCFFFGSGGRGLFILSYAEEVWPATHRPSGRITMRLWWASAPGESIGSNPLVQPAIKSFMPASRPFYTSRGRFDAGAHSGHSSRRAAIRAACSSTTPECGRPSDKRAVSGGKACRSETANLATYRRHRPSCGAVNLTPGERFVLSPTAWPARVSKPSAGPHDGLAADVRTCLGRGLGPGWFAERLHGNALITHIDDFQFLRSTRRAKDHRVAWPGFHQRPR